MSQGDLKRSNSNLDEDPLDREIQEPVQFPEAKINNGTPEQQFDEPPNKRVDFSPSSDEVIRTLKKLKEDANQVHELNTEESSIVNAFFKSFLLLMEPLAKALPVNILVLQPVLGPIVNANIVPKGDLIILFPDNRMESIDLSLIDNRDLLVIVISDVIPKLNRLFFQRLNKLENRINFLSSVTQELQNISETFSEIF